MEKKEHSISFSEKMIMFQCVFAFVLLLLVGIISMMGFWVEPKGVIDASVITIVSIFLGVAGAMFGINSFADNRKYTSATMLNTELVKLHDDLMREVKSEMERKNSKEE